MTIRRRYGGSMPPFIVSTKSSRSRSFTAMPTRYLRTAPVSRADKVAYDTRAEDYLTDRVTNASIFSNYAMNVGYDTAKKSRSRDEMLLRDATDAIVSSESFATPQTSVAARRVARSLAPRAASAPPRPLYPEVVMWDFPKRYKPLYETDTTKSTTTEAYYPDLSYSRRPIVVYAKSLLPQAPDQVFMRKSPDRAMSVPPLLYFREDQRRKIMPVIDDWRRTARAKTVPAEVMPVPRRWYLPYYERMHTPYYRRKLALSLSPRAVAVMPLPTEGLRAHKMPRHYLSRGALRTGFPSHMGYYDDWSVAKRRQEEGEELRFGIRPRVLASPLARATLARAMRLAVPPFAPSRARLAFYEESKYGFPLLFVPRKGSKRSQKAAIIASKVEADYVKSRRPRSEYAARKYRSMHRNAQESIYAKAPRTSGMYASYPPLPKLTERKAIRTEEGYSKPKNLLSWQYRLESIMRPSDLLQQPASFSRIRKQVREAQDRMDRHRQMLDRYLPEEGESSSDAAARVLRKMAEVEKRDFTSGESKGEEKARSKEAPY